MSLNEGYVYREKLGRRLGKSALEHLSENYRHSSLAEWEARFARGEIQLDGVTAKGQTDNFEDYLFRIKSR